MRQEKTGMKEDILIRKKSGWKSVLTATVTDARMGMFVLSVGGLVSS